MKKKKLLIISIILVIISIGIYLEISYLLNQNNSEYKEVANSPTYLEKETIETSISNFNTVISDNGLRNLISKDDYVSQNNVYHYEIHENINFYIKPVEYTGNQVEEITYDLGIYYPKDSEYEGDAIIYVKLLIKANNNDLSEEEIEGLINDAVGASKEDKDVNKNTGISIRYFDAAKNNNYKEFVIRRHYKYE